VIDLAVASALLSAALIDGGSAPSAGSVGAEAGPSACSASLWACQALPASFMTFMLAVRRSRPTRPSYTGGCARRYSRRKLIQGVVTFTLSNFQAARGPARRAVSAFETQSDGGSLPGKTDRAS
jgi:hypothetical protein